jgi:drug/metabolite transporter (DMT)-like permease
VLAIVGGLGAALCWATSSLASARSARRIGAWSTVAWVMLIGTAVAAPLAFVAGGGATFTPTVLTLLVIAGASNVLGLALVYTAFGAGKVAVLAPIVSTEGAMGAVISIVLGEQVALPVVAVLAIIAAGVILTASERSGSETVVEPGALAAIEPTPVQRGRESGLAQNAPGVRAVVLALSAAFLFGINLYSSARIGAELPIVWSMLPARLAGAVGLAIPLLVLRRLRLTREAVPFVVVVALAEVIGTGLYAFGARDGIAVAAVMSSQFGAIAAIASVLLFGEKLRRLQVVGVGVIAAGVATLAALQAA